MQIKFIKNLNEFKKIIIAVLSIFVIIFLVFIKQKSNNSTKEITISSFEKGLNFYNAKQYLNAREKFAYISADDSNFSSAQTYIKICDNRLHFEKGLNYYNSEQYLDARNEFGNITPDDSNYSVVLEYIKICDKGSDNELKERNRLEQKYNKIIGGNGWLHEKQSKLLNLDFKQYKSEYEDAPDGSKQIATYYKKSESGFVVNVMLQYSYSLEHHYVKIWIEK